MPLLFRISLSHMLSSTKHQIILCYASGIMKEWKDRKESDPEGETIVCHGCGKNDDHEMLLCDARFCGRAYHLFCLTPKLKAIPSGDWICPRCDASARKKKTNDSEVTAIYGVLIVG